MELINYINTVLKSSNNTWSGLARELKKKQGVCVQRKVKRAIAALNKVFNLFGYEVWIRELKNK